MRAMLLERVCSLDVEDTPLRLANVPTPEPGRGEVLLKVLACGVCHTEIDEIEGRTAPPRYPVIPGHEVIGRVVQLGEGVEALDLDQRVGVGWIFRSDGSADENVSNSFVATGRDVNGGYAEFMTVPSRYAYPVPETFSDVEAAPLLCAGAIGYRAVRLSGIRAGQRLGLTGFGGSAHLVLKLVQYLYPDVEVYVFVRAEETCEFAVESGAVWAGVTEAQAPEKLDAVIDTTPAWLPIVAALGNLKPGGRLVINAIRKEDRDRESLLKLSYHDHLWMEKEIKTVANITGRDIREFLEIAAAAGFKPEIEIYPLEAANEALVSLHRGVVRGAKVLKL